MKKLFPVWLAALLCLVGCTNEEIANAPIKKGTIQATFENEASRLAVGEGNALTWTKGDAFTMFDGMNESSVWTLQGNGGTEMGVFEGAELEGPLRGAAFPASANPSYQWGTLTMTLPSELAYEPGICNLPMWAKITSLEGDITFQHMCALLKIDFTDIPEGYDKLIVNSSKAIAGTFTASCNAAEPVLALKENGLNSVTVTFDKIEGTDNDRLFYLPLPVGDYASINVSISDGENTLSIADWSDRSIVRKKVYLASLTYRVSDAATPAAITSELKTMTDFTSNPTVEIASQIKAEDGDIVLPSEASTVGLNFAQVPVTTSAAPLTFVEESGIAKAQLSVSLPTSAQGVDVKFDTPNTTVQVEGGNYNTIQAHTAANTLVLGEGTTVKDLVVLGGNVSFKGGEVTGSITRDASNGDAVTYVYVNEADDLEGITLGTGVQMVLADYVTFTADAEQTFKLSKEVQTLEYSVGGGKWTELRSSTVTFGGDKGTLRLRGKNGWGTAASRNFNESSSVVFGDATVPVAASGNILTLADYEKCDSEGFDTSNVRFCFLFNNCSNLTSSPSLPATTLAEGCYQGMFGGTGLTEIPELPATTLADWCYSYMFQRCTGLTEVPAFPITTLAANCYAGMFGGCIGLTEAPALPATTLAEGCYQSMFNGCTGLTEAPALPATTLAANCYEGMFGGCTGLTEAPELPATTLANYCYCNMFNGCTSLTETPELPAITLAEDCYRGMFYGCTGLTKAHTLPATTLKLYCYYSMFQGCTSLTEAPALPATTLALSCYENMFRGCSSLAVAPELPATTLAPFCYRYMLQETKLTVAPELPATTLTAWCYSGMFCNCTELTQAPVLAAPTLANRSYTWMFEGCSSLTEVTMLATDVSAEQCLGGWLNGVSATGTLYKNSALEDVSTLGIPEGWEVKDFAYQIRYTSTDGNIVTPNSSAIFGANIVSNTYENGVGIIEFDGPVTTIGYNRIGWEETGAFSRCETLKSIEIPNTVTNIDAYAFYQCTELQDVTLPDKITAIKEFTFTNNSLESVVIPDGVTSIAARAFLYNMKLTSVTLPKELVTIGESAFAWCNALPSVTIPEKVTSIGRGAFINDAGEGESALTTVYCKAVNPPTIDAESQIFGSSSTITIYVPANSLSAYTAQWGNLTYSFCYTIEASTEY